MAGQHHLNPHFDGALHYCIEVLHLEPEQHTIAVGSVGAIANGPVMVLDFKAVQLQDDLAILYQLLILPAAVRPAAAEQALIPPAAGFDIRDTNERLGVHGPSLTEPLLGRSECEETGYRIYNGIGGVKQKRATLVLERGGRGQGRRRRSSKTLDAAPHPAHSLRDEGRRSFRASS